MRYIRRRYPFNFGVRKLAYLACGLLKSPDYSQSCLLRDAVLKVPLNPNQPTNLLRDAMLARYMLFVTSVSSYKTQKTGSHNGLGNEVP